MTLEYVVTVSYTWNASSKVTRKGLRLLAPSSSAKGSCVEFASVSLVYYIALMRLRGRRSMRDVVLTKHARAVRREGPFNHCKCLLLTHGAPQLGPQIHPSILRRLSTAGKKQFDPPPSPEVPFQHSPYDQLDVAG